MEQTMQKIIPGDKEKINEKAFIEEFEMQRAAAIERFKIEYCDLCKNATLCKPFFDLYGNCWGYSK